MAMSNLNIGLSTVPAPKGTGSNPGWNEIPLLSLRMVVVMKQVLVIQESAPS